MFKKALKFIVHALSLILVFPVFLLYLIIGTVSDKDQVFSSTVQFLSLLPGVLGSYIRVAFFRLSLDKCEQDIFIGFGTLFSQRHTELGHGVYIGPQGNIGKCRIEKNCLLGSGVHIMSGKQQHNFTSLETPIRDQGGHFESITVGEDSWIGNGSLIMASVGKKCIVGAGSVVSKDIPDYSIVTGNPARIIKSRLEE